MAFAEPLERCAIRADDVGIDRFGSGNHPRVVFA